MNFHRERNRTDKRKQTMDMLLDGTQNMCRKQNNNKNEIIETQDTHSDSKKKVHTYIYIYV